MDENILKVLRTRTGLAGDDTTMDAMLELNWEGAIQWAEEYLDRFLEPGQREEEFTHIAGDGTVQLRGYPVVSIEDIAVSSGNTLPDYHLDRRTGLLQFDSQLVAHTLTVSYEQGNPLKGPLFIALLNLFDAINGGMNGDSVAAQVKGTAIDGMRVDYAVGSSAANPLQTMGMPDDVVGMLAPFRRWSC